MLGVVRKRGVNPYDKPAASTGVLTLLVSGAARACAILNKTVPLALELTPPPPSPFARRRGGLRDFLSSKRSERPISK